MCGDVRFSGGPTAKEFMQIVLLLIEWLYVLFHDVTFPKIRGRIGAFLFSVKNAKIVQL